MMATIFSAIPAVLYLLISFFFGVQLLRFLFPDSQRIFMGVAPKRATLQQIPTVLFYYPAGLIVGLTLVTFVTYFLAYVMTPFMPRDMAVLLPTNIVTLCVSLYLASLMWQKRYSRRRAQALPANDAPDGAPVRRRLGAHRNPTPRPMREKRFIQDFVPAPGRIVFYALTVLGLLVVVSFFYYSSYYISGTKLFAGYSVFSDLAPHTALVSSFAKGMNFPTQYPHFPDGSIRYHFLFYFLCGNLHALGMPIDHALNIPTILSAVACFVLLGSLAVLLFGRKSAFLLAPVLVIFRSSAAIFSQILALAGLPGATFQSVVSGILSNSEFIGLTPYDNWGLWANNVYANQRHLLFGVALIIILIFFFLPHVRRMFLHLRKEVGIKAKLRRFFLRREAWLPRHNDPIRPVHLAILSAIVVSCMPYFHGSALITLLLILLVLAIFSECRLIYLTTAIAAVASSFLQTFFFSGGAGNVVSPAFYPGFVVAEPAALQILLYVAQLTGIACVLFVILLFVQKSAYRVVLMLSFAVPFIFAFLVILTVDVTSNHKFIQISLILLSTYLAGLLAFLLTPFAPVATTNDEKSETEGNAAGVRTPSIAGVRSPVTQGVRAPVLPGETSFVAEEAREPLQEVLLAPAKGVTPPNRNRILRILATTGTRILAVILLALLTASGISDTFVYVNKNRGALEMRLDSPTVAWITENTPSRAVFLTAPYSMHSFLLSGRSMYFGHPYYAWSAGYDTDARSAIYADLLTGCGGDRQAFVDLCAQEGISYILVDGDMLSIRDYNFDPDFFAKNFTVEASFPEDNQTVIYRVQ